MIRKPLRSISGLPEDQHKDLISFLQCQPAFNSFEARVHVDSSDGGQTQLPGSLSGSVATSYLECTYRYKDYDVEVLAVLGEIYITCKKSHRSAQQ